MRAHEFITESPINDFQVDIQDLNDRNKNSDVIFNPNDRKYLKRKSYQSAIRKRFDKLNATFNIYIHNPDEKHRLGLLGNVDHEKAKSLIPNIRIHPDEITIIYSNNVTRNYIPLTPWILIHRLGHMLGAGATVLHHKPSKEKANKEFMNFYNSILKAGELIHNIIKGINYPNGGPNVSDCLRMIKPTLTMKSARDNVVQDTDIIDEIFTQGVWSTIKFKNPYSDHKQAEEIQYILESLQNDLQARIPLIFDEAKGKVWAF